MKQTSVEWLINQIKSDQNQKALSPSEWSRVFEQAKAMHKEEIEQAYYDGGDEMCPNGIAGGKQAESYYNETYKKD